MNFLKQVILSFLIMSTCLLWGIVSGFSNNEIAIVTVTIIVVQWLQYLGSKNEQTKTKD